MTLSALFALVVGFLGTQVTQILIGLAGTALEELGERKNSKLLVAIGTRLEAFGNDVPKLFKGK